MPYSIIATDPVTGKVITSPATYDRVRYALLSPKGKILPIAEAPVQLFTKTDFAGMNRSLSGSRNYIVYEELTRRIQRDEHGRKVPRKDKQGNTLYRFQPSGRKVPIYYREKKFTFFRKERPQRPVLYDRSRRQRELDIGFKTLSPRQQADQKAMLMAKPDDGKTYVYHMEGVSVRDAMSNLVLNIDKQDIYGPAGRKVAGLFYSVVTYITDPEGNQTRIPTSGALSVMSKFSDIFPDLMSIATSDGPAFMKQVRTLANLNRELSYSVSASMARVGYRFTTMRNLKTYAAQMNRNAKRLYREAKAHKAKGHEKQAEKKFKSAERVQLARARMLKEKAKTRLASGRYKVRLHLTFRTVPVRK